MSDIEDKLKSFIERLDAYETRISLKTPANLPNIEEYMSLDKTQLHTMSDEDCGIAAVQLSQYATYLQREINRQLAIKNWAEANLHSLVAAHNNEYDKFVKFEIKKFLIEKENGAAKKLNDILITAGARVDSLSYLTTRIQNQSETLLALQQTKRSRK